MQLLLHPHLLHEAEDVSWPCTSSDDLWSIIWYTSTSTRAHTKACVCRSLSVYINFLIFYKVRSMMIWCCRIKIWSMCKGIPVQGGNPWFECRHEITRLQWGVQPTGVNQHAQTLCHLRLQPQCYLATTGHLHCLCWQIHLQPAKIKTVQSAKT